jgi:hypothetical protein
MTPRPADGKVARQARGHYQVGEAVLPSELQVRRCRVPHGGGPDGEAMAVVELPGDDREIRLEEA